MEGLSARPKSARFSPDNWRANRFPQILRQFVQRFSLSNDGQIEALGDELVLASENVNLDNFLHLALS
jgi:hypothetical protein